MLSVRGSGPLVMRRWRSTRVSIPTGEVGSRDGVTTLIVPNEPVWSNLKRSLANLTKQDIGQLTALVKARLRRMQYRPGLPDGFLAKTGLDLGNFHN